uniref:EB domain-containing protein n=1 Tax=Steinernema glaseri TaxID=37863 RepID=A0A1I8A348_9BILA
MILSSVRRVLTGPPRTKHAIFPSKSTLFNRAFHTLPVDAVDNGPLPRCEANKQYPGASRSARVGTGPIVRQHVGMVQAKLFLAIGFVALCFGQESEERLLSKRQIYAAPLYSPCGPTVGCAAPGICQAALCVPVPAPVAPMVPLAPAPVVAAPPPYVEVPAVSIVAACAPACLPNAACVQGVCTCRAPAIAYSPVVGCAPIPPPMPAVPVVAGRLIPQAMPGAPCEPGVECTGGSVCSQGICLCPPELVQEGTVCVSRTIYGIVPPPPPVVVAPAPMVVGLGAPCGVPVAAAVPTCVQGAVCSAGVCQCGPAFVPSGPACVRRRHAAPAKKSD